MTAYPQEPGPEHSARCTELRCGDQLRLCTQDWVPEQQGPAGANRALWGAQPALAREAIFLTVRSFGAQQPGFDSWTLCLISHVGQAKSFNSSEPQFSHL